jgi:hypothetical protein
VRNLVPRLAALVTISLAAQAALADDWTITRLRGAVVQLVEGEWLPLKRADIVPDDRRIKTTNNGYATLVRGNETLELGPSTQIRIIDEGGGSRPYTTVLQSWGTVDVQAEVRNVEHFAVRNQYLAAVVKGTRFSVSATSGGGAVDVEQGRVSVGGSEQSTVVSAGQNAQVHQDGSISVSGQGALPATVEKSGKSGTAVSDAVAAAAAELERAKAAGDLAAIKVAKDALNDAAKAAEDAEKVTDKDEKDATKAAEDARKAAEKAAEDARKAAEKAAKDAEKNVNSGDDGEDSGKGGGDDVGGNSGKGKPDDTDGKGKH